MQNLTTTTNKPTTYKPPDNLDNVNRGVSTILNGVSKGKLSEILRGSFMFTRNEKVKKVANNVLDAIFGPRDPNLDKEQENGTVFNLFPLKGL